MLLVAALVRAAAVRAAAVCVDSGGFIVLSFFVDSFLVAVGERDVDGCRGCIGARRFIIGTTRGQTDERAQRQRDQNGTVGRPHVANDPQSLYLHVAQYTEFIWIAGRSTHAGKNPAISLGAILDSGTLEPEKRIVLKDEERVNVRTPGIRPAAAVVAALSLAVAACGSDDGESSESETTAGEASDSESGADGASPTNQPDAPAADQEAPTIVVTTNVLGDVMQQVVGDSAEVVTIMPVGADPHDFQASAQEVDALNNADALIVNGAGFEEGLLDVIEGAEGEGVPTFEAISVVDTIEFGEAGHEHDDEELHGAEEEHSDDEHDDHAGVDPHFFTDPMRMAEAVEGIVDFLQDEVEFADPAALDASADAYIAELTELDGAVVELVESIPDQRRVLVTNHEVFGYFADRYGFEVVGAVVPGGSTTDSASAGELAELAEQVEAEEVPAIFADTSSSDELAEALASEVGDVAVVELYSESLGESGSDGATYLEMVLTNAERMSVALA